MGNAVRAMPIGANLPVKFWPCALCHFAQVHNALPGSQQTKSPLEITTGHQDDFTGFKTFGCRVWVKPPSRRKAKFKSNAKKGMFLGFLPHTARNIMWCDTATDGVEIATHSRFDEGMNDLPIESLPPNVQYSLRTEGGNRTEPPLDPNDTHSNQLQFFTYPFATTFEGTIPLPCSNEHCGLVLADDSILMQSHVTDIVPESSTSKLMATLKQTMRKVKGACITKVGDIPVFSSADVAAAIKVYQGKGRSSVLHLPWNP